MQESYSEGKRHEQPEENLMPEWFFFPEGRLSKDLWVAGRSGEDKEEWMDEVRARYERCYDDKGETSEVQAERVQEQ